jgi:hypothetical protein
MPARSPDGAESQRITSRPRAGRAWSSTSAWRATRRRSVRSSGRTTSRDARRALYAPALVRDALDPAEPSRRDGEAASTDTTDDLTSTTSSVRVGLCQPRRSIEPRSPYREKVTSSWSSSRLRSTVPTWLRQERRARRRGPDRHQRPARGPRSDTQPRGRCRPPAARPVTSRRADPAPASRSTAD